MLDEPSAGLAPAIVSDLFARIAGLRDNGLTILLVEQLAEQALQIADHVSVINDGTVIAGGMPAEFSDMGELQKAYFGS